jgi:hypothetical protein
MAQGSAVFPGFIPIGFVGPPVPAQFRVSRGNIHGSVRFDLGPPQHERQVTEAVI